MRAGVLARGPEPRAAHGWPRRLLITVLVVVLAFAAVTARLLVWPAQGMPARTDAIVMLAGPGDRLSVALSLAREKRALVLVVSTGHLGYGSPCPATAATPDVTIMCFDPDPATTRGEAEYVARLARRYGWRSIALVVTPQQDARASMLFHRCYQGTVYAVTTPQPTWSQLAYQIAYGWGAMLKALIFVRAC